jgi:SNF2 family DNA or RNA helicase
MAWFHSVPQDEKIIVYSFFKGGLDLIEGILYHDFGLQCARFDGDFDPKLRQADLDRFKTDPSCRVLLMTVQSVSYKTVGICSVLYSLTWLLTPFSP